MKTYKYSWLSNIGIAAEIGGVIYVLLGIFLQEGSKIIAGIVGGFLGLILILIGFLIERKKFRKFVNDNED